MGEWEKSRLSFFVAMRVCLWAWISVNIIECLIFHFILYNVISLFARFFAVILNPNDFDFLLSRGNSSGHINPRDSILERFDPILGRVSVVPSVLINRLEPSVATTPPTITTTNASPAAVAVSAEAAAPIITSHSISTIKEVDSFLESSPVSNRADDQLISIKQSPVTNQSAPTINERKNSSSSKSANTIVNKLASAEKTEHSNSLSIGGDGDYSQASSTTETYETASIGEPQKVSFIYLSIFWLF